MSKQTRQIVCQEAARVIKFKDKKLNLKEKSRQLDVLEEKSTETFMDWHCSNIITKLKLLPKYQWPLTHLNSLGLIRADFLQQVILVKPSTFLFGTVSL